MNFKWSFQDLDVQLNTGNVLDILKKKKKKKENVQQIMRRGGVEPGFIVSGTKILTTRLPTTVNDFGSISTFKICKVLAFIGVTADRHVVQT